MQQAPASGRPRAAFPPPGRPPVVSAKPKLVAPAQRSETADRWSLLVLLAIPAALSLVWLHYYVAERSERVRDPVHALLKPGGSVGLSFGIVGFAFFLFMWLYPLRKKFRWLAWTGKLPSWMRVHTVAGLALPGLVAVHAGWRFEGLIGLGFLAMMLVVLSGIVGRYLYVRIPRSQAGLELTLEDASNERRAIVTRIAATTGLLPSDVEQMLVLDPAPTSRLGTGRALILLVTSDFTRWRAVRHLTKRFARPGPGRKALDHGQLVEVTRLARREMTLAHQIRAFEATRRLFALWHVAHRPVAITALVAILIHVVVAVLMGAVGS